MNRSQLAILASVLFLSACASTGEKLANAVTAPDIASPPVELPTRERALDAPDYRDCNHNVLDGRETDVKTSNAHCGACDHPCEKGSCERGVCVEP